MSRRAPIILSTVFAGLLLAGCTAGTTDSTPGDPEPASGQTVAEACAIALDDVAAASEGMADALGEMFTDPTVATTMLSDIAADMHESADGLENAEVQTAVEEAATSLDALSEVTAAAFADPQNADQQALTDASDDVEEKFATLSELCPTS